MAVHDEREFDPRAWNLFAGAALLAGCSARTAVGDGESETSTDDGSVIDSGTDTTDTTTGDGDGDGDGDDGYYGSCGRCNTDSDCSPCESYGPWVCEDGNCVPGYECIWDYSCPQFALCVSYECIPQGTPVPNCGFDEFDIPTVHEDIWARALDFVDVDGDGDDELVAANTTQLYVYEFGSDIPTTSPRISSIGPIEMAAGHLDAQPGEDLVLLVEDEIHRYFSDSGLGLLMPTAEASPLAEPAGLIAGDFDGTAFTDLLLWGSQGALLDLDDATVPLTNERTGDGAGFDYGSSAAGVAAIHPGHTAAYDLLGNQQSQNDGWVLELGSMMEGDQPRYFTAAEYDSDDHDSYWAEITVLNAPDLSLRDTIFVPGAGAYANESRGYVAGDFDGDGNDEILSASGSSIQVVFGVFTQPCVATQDPGGGSYEYGIAAGDHDGDGDDEVALIQGVHVLIVDVE